MKKNGAIMVVVTVIFLALILPYPSVAETLLAPRTTTTQPTTTITSPTLIQQPAIQPAPIEGMGVGNAIISVSDSYGNPVKAAAVIIAINVANNQLLTQTTNYQGIASFSGVAVGQFTYSVSKAGYYPQTINMPLSIGRATTTASKYVLIKYGSARVNVVDNGVAVAGAKVKTGTISMLNAVFDPTRSTIDMFAETDTGGMASFANIPPGNYRFSALKDGYKDGQTTAYIAPGQVATVTIALSKRTGGLEVTVKSGGAVLAGAVVDLTYADTYRFSSWSGLILSRTTNSQGVATFSNLPIGAYSIRTSKTGYSGYQQAGLNVLISENLTTQVVSDMIRQP